MKPIFHHLLGLKVTPVSQALPEEIHLPALGESWSVRYRRTGSRWVQARCNGGGVLAVSGRVDDGGEVFKGLSRWLSRQARNSLVPWLNELSEQAGLPYGNTSIRGQRTRWASCSSRGNINLNYRLLFLSPDLVRYVLLHELCHTLHLNHSRDFWTKLASLEPEYKELYRRVKTGMDEVPQWAKDQ